jgi:hypothetical protein
MHHVLRTVRALQHTITIFHGIFALTCFLLRDNAASIEKNVKKIIFQQIQNGDFN